MQSTFFEVLQVTATSRDILEAACGYSRGSPVGPAPPGRQSQAVRAGMPLLRALNLLPAQDCQ
jgi:hypothetical protein